MTNEQIAAKLLALEERIQELEEKVEPIYQQTRCPFCDNAAQDEHECDGDYNDTGSRCRCCPSCSRNCAASA